MKYCFYDNDKSTTYMEAMMGLDSVKWLDAIKSGKMSIYENQVLELDRPSERHKAYRT